MLYARISEDGTVLKWPVKEETLRQVLSNITLPKFINDEVLAGTGFVAVPAVLKTEIPPETKDQKVQLSNTLVLDNGQYKRQYILVDVPAYVHPLRLERKWRQLREQRDKRMADFDWRIARLQRQLRLGETPVDDITVLDAYMKALADMTACDDPFLAVWPTTPVTPAIPA